ncbi:MAG: Si-specific NAD(P)(+) transhydrogenase [SAR324 cluster bacterium]|uniref:NAD(P)(+) transhydrogenase (Si-specific) n=1 Tax=SAR324 cluster bacterium TaxID=2024889 RepID=A0A2A4SRM7_9DELT|nr:MAG: Si-specific NAD(P)(+) transhydrogenase [SAR324 cluster bacterium]
MKSLQFDIVVIGAGPAGEKAALEAARLGASVAVIEKGGRPGGASVISGTLPSKSLWETVRYVDSISNKEISGFDINLNRKVSIKQLMHRSKVVMEKRVDDILRNYQQAGVHYIHGEAKFLDTKRLVVEAADTGQAVEVEAEKIIIAVGTRPYHPPDVGFDGKYVLDSDTILNLDEIPKDIAIYGGGVIGCEYASIFSKLGTRVYLIDPRGTLLDFIDHELSLSLAYFMQSEGVVLRLGEQYESIQLRNGKVQIKLNSGRMINASRLLYANGRQGTADLLDLEKCGLTMNSRNQLDVNHNYQTAVPNIYSVGDIIGFPSLVSVSNEEGRMAARHAIQGKEMTRVGGEMPTGIYTLPEIAGIGPTEKQLMEDKVCFEVGVCQFRDLARGLIMGEKGGMLKLLFHCETHELLGVHILGSGATELIHIGQAVMHFKGKIEYFLDAVFNFPTLSSAYKVAARDGLSRLA